MLDFGGDILSHRSEFLIGECNRWPPDGMDRVSLAPAHSRDDMYMGMWYLLTGLGTVIDTDDRGVGVNCRFDGGDQLVDTLPQRRGI